MPFCVGDGRGLLFPFGERPGAEGFDLPPLYIACQAAIARAFARSGDVRPLPLISAFERGFSRPAESVAEGGSTSCGEQSGGGRSGVDIKLRGKGRGPERAVGMKKTWHARLPLVCQVSALVSERCVAAGCEPYGRALSICTNTLDTLSPSALMAAMEMIMIKASMTAYSVAVAPSSSLTNDLIRFTRCFITVPPPPALNRSRSTTERQHHADGRFPLPDLPPIERSHEKK